jgi:hypothetical protein
MENTQTTMETYTSPSGNRYEVHPRVYTRAAGGILEGGDLYDVEETTYEVFHSGGFVTFANEEADVLDAINRFENPGADLGSRFD